MRPVSQNRDELRCSDPPLSRLPTELRDEQPERGNPSTNSARILNQPVSPKHRATLHPEAKTGARIGDRIRSKSDRQTSIVDADSGGFISSSQGFEVCD